MPRRVSQLGKCWHWYFPTSSISLKTSTVFEGKLFLERLSALLWPCTLLWAIWVTFPPMCWASIILLSPGRRCFVPPCSPASDRALLSEHTDLICLPQTLLIMICIQRFINRATHDLPTLRKMRAELLCVGYICIGFETILHLIHIPTEDMCGSAEMQMHWLFFSTGVTLWTQSFPEQISCRYNQTPQQNCLNGKRVAEKQRSPFVSGERTENH